MDQSKFGVLIGMKTEKENDWEDDLNIAIALKNSFTGLIMKLINNLV